MCQSPRRFANHGIPGRAATQGVPPIDTSRQLPTSGMSSGCNSATTTFPLHLERISLPLDLLSTQRAADNVITAAAGGG